MECVRFIINNVLVGFDADIDTCKLLLSDDAFAIDFIHRAVRTGGIDHISVEDLPTLNIIRPGEQPYAPLAQGDGAEGIKETIWFPKRKPTIKDTEATEYFLTIRSSSKYLTLFNDKKTHKMKLWQEIANLMNAKDFYVGEGKEASEKLRLKFNSIQKQYLNYLKHMKSTGETPTTEPPFYEYMLILFGNKDKFHPRKLIDSFNNEKEDDAVSPTGASQESTFYDSLCAGPSSRPHLNITPQSSKSLNIVNSSQLLDNDNAEFEQETVAPDQQTDRFSRAKNCARPKSTREHLIDVIKECNEQQLTAMNTRFDSLCQLIAEQNRQRDTLISILQDIVKPQKKRKRISESDSD